MFVGSSAAAHCPIYLIDLCGAFFQLLWSEGALRSRLPPVHVEPQSRPAPLLRHHHLVGLAAQLLDEIRSAAPGGAFQSIAPPEQGCSKEQRTAMHYGSPFHLTSNAPSLGLIGVAPLDTTRPKWGAQGRVPDRSSGTLR